LETSRALPEGFALDEPPLDVAILPVGDAARGDDERPMPDRLGARLLRNGDKARLIANAVSSVLDEDSPKGGKYETFSSRAVSGV
jgi:hypothetical protein